MAIAWAITSTAERVELGGEIRGETSFTVTNPAAGAYAFQGRAYSADTAPEEGSRLSGRVVGYLIFRPDSEPPPPAGFSGEPRAYAAEVLAAWVGPQSARLVDLTNAPANQELNAFPRPPNVHWTFVDCHDAVGASFCQFYKNFGETIMVRLRNEQHGKAQAAVDATLSSLPGDLVRALLACIKSYFGASFHHPLEA
jgi:hypothetical protein